MRWTRGPHLTVDGGILANLRDVSQGPVSIAGANPLSAITSMLRRSYVASPFLEALWRPGSRTLIRPGLRADSYSDGTTTKSNLDPRLTVRFKLLDRDLPDMVAGSDESALWLKASAGIYHQPPRFVLPLPGLDMMPLRYGLLRSYQTSLGVEIPLAHRFQLSCEGFLNYMDPTIFDLSVNNASVVTNPNGTLVPTMLVTPPMDGQEFIDRLTTPQTGRAYGLEVLLRRQSKTGVFGWLSYTLSRSERIRGLEWIPYDFDRTHLLNLVGGLPLRRNWDIGMRWQYQSGKPTTTTAGYNAARGAGYVRFDLRVDKRAVWRRWLLDFYVDITNVALLPEEVTPGVAIRYVLPTLGIRGRF